MSSEGGYDKFLPSINFTAELTDSLVLRGAASQTLMRPALTDLAYKRTASWSSFRFTDGNPNLKPTFADQWEIGLEKYLPEGGLLAVSYFNKKIEGVVRQALTGTVKNVIASTTPTARSTASMTSTSTSQSTRPARTRSAASNWWPSCRSACSTRPLKGFGVNANYTILDSSLIVVDHRHPDPAGGPG